MSIDIDLTAATGFVTTHARLLDRQRLRLAVGEDARSAVLRAVDGYRNDDGGYGWGSSPTSVRPRASPAARSTRSKRSPRPAPAAHRAGGRTLRLARRHRAPRRGDAVRAPDHRPDGMRALLGRGRRHHLVAPHHRRGHRHGPARCPPRPGGRRAPLAGGRDALLPRCDRGDRPADARAPAQVHARVPRHRGRRRPRSRRADRPPGRARSPPRAGCTSTAGSRTSSCGRSTSRPNPAGPCGPCSRPTSWPPSWSGSRAGSRTTAAGPRSSTPTPQWRRSSGGVTSPCRRSRCCGRTGSTGRGIVTRRTLDPGSRDYRASRCRDSPSTDPRRARRGLRAAR